MSISQTLKEELFKEETDEVFICLITISHAALETPLRATSDNVNTVSNGDTFVPYAFDLRLQQDEPKQAPTARIRIDNVSRDIIRGLRSIRTAPNIRLQVVRNSDPDTYEIDLDGLKLMQVDYNALDISGDLILEDLSVEPYPVGTFVPSKFPGLF